VSPSARTALPPAITRTAAALDVTRSTGWCGCRYACCQARSRWAASRSEWMSCVHSGSSRAVPSSSRRGPAPGVHDAPPRDPICAQRDGPTPQPPRKRDSRVPAAPRRDGAGGRLASPQGGGSTSRSRPGLPAGSASVLTELNAAPRADPLSVTSSGIDLDSAGIWCNMARLPFAARTRSCRPLLIWRGRRSQLALPAQPCRRARFLSQVYRDLVCRT
jgi:hypothetical protein